MKIFFFIIYILFIKNTFQNHIIYPFRKSIKENKTYPENLLQNDLEITLKIGTPPQRIDLNLRSQAYAFSVTSSELNLPYPTFNETNSKSLLKLDNKTTNYWQQEFEKGYPITETIIINNKEIKNVSLVLATSLTYNQSGSLGLRPIKSHEAGGGYLSFIYQIKKLANLDNYSFSLKYNDDKTGELIIGSYPHLYDKNYKENNFYYSRARNIGANIEWVLDFDDIRYNNKSISSINIKGLFKIDFGLIQAPSILKQYFDKNIFNNKCKEDFYQKRNITIIHCDKELNISNIKNISFILRDIGFEFILTYKDLFIKNENEYIFTIVFDTNKKIDPIWIFGKPFMKKYQLIYDLDRKIIGLYKDNNNSDKKINLYLIFLIILVIIVIILIVFIIYYIKKPRKNRANELVDDIDYIPSD